MDFYSNLIIFYQTGPHFGGKLISFVAILAKNTCVCGCRPVLYYFKVNISLLEMFMKPGMGIIDNFLLQPRHFVPSQTQYWRNIDKFCSCSGPKHMFILLQTDTMPFKLQYQFIVKVCEAWGGIIDEFVLPPHHFLSKPSPFLRKIDQFCDWSGLKHKYVG